MLAKGAIRTARSTCFLVCEYEAALDCEKDKVSSLESEKTSLLQRLKASEDQVRSVEEEARSAKEEITLRAQNKLNVARKYIEEKGRAFPVTSEYGQVKAVSETLRTLVDQRIPISSELVEGLEKETVIKKKKAEQCVVSDLYPNVFSMNSSYE